MAFFGGIYNTLIDESDFTPDTQVQWGDGESYKSTYTVTGVGPYANGDSFFPSSGYLPALFTLSASHDLVEMTMVQFASSFNIPIVGGTTANFDPNLYTYGVHYNPATMSANQFAVGIQIAGTAVGTASVSGTVTRARRYHPPVSVLVSLANQLGAHLWVNVPPADPTSRAAAGWTAAFRQIARELDSSLRCYVEFSNEPWNPAFPPFHYLTWKANKLGTTLMGAYANLAAQWHAVARAAFALESRSISDVVRVFGTFTGNPSFTLDMVEYAAANSVPIDYLATAPYLYIQPELQTGLDDAYDALTDAQTADVAEYCLKWYDDVTRQNISVHRGYLDDNGYTSAGICCYEMGPAYARLGGTGENQARHTQGLHKNPRFKNMMLAYYKEQQDQGVDFGLQYTIATSYGQEGGESGTNMYGAYLGCDMEAGNGDGSDGKNDNRVDPYVVAGKVSVAGQAVLDWNAAAAVVRRWWGFARRKTRRGMR